MTDPVAESFRRMKEARDRQRSSADADALRDLADRATDAEGRWDEARLVDALAPVLASILADAGRQDGAAVARALAPNIVGTIKREITNSEDQIIEALYPHMGRLIGEAVTKAVDDLRLQVDNALPLERWIADMRARLSGGSALGALMSGSEGRFAVREAYLIERGSGTLIAREMPSGVTQGDDALDDDLVAGMIAALDSFAQDAFGPSGIGALRQLSLDQGTVYLRTSPTKLLAIRCSGPCPGGGGGADRHGAVPGDRADA